MKLSARNILKATVKSVTPGAVDSEVIVELAPCIEIVAIRHTRIVMMDGNLMDADALRAAGGFAGRPKFVD